MPLTIYHNPRCSKSRKTLEIIEESGTAVEVVHYLENTPTAARIIAIARLAGVAVDDLVRRNEPEYRHARDLPSPGDEAALAAWLAAHPIVIERPIVVDDEAGRAVTGRPPENVLALIDR